jgi:protein SCO1/2
MPDPGPRAGLTRRGRRTITVIALFAVVAALVAACGATGGSRGDAPGTPVFVEAVTQAPMGERETAYDPPRPAPALRLTDGGGEPFDLERLRGRPVFVYFGYTHCPDVCPSTLADLRAGIKASGVDATVVFVTVDPERDDGAAMKQYTDFYDAGFIGLTGTAEEIAAAAEAWGVSYERLPSESAGGYAMAHSTDSYLVDADGQLRHHVFFGAPADLIADLLREVSTP